MSVKIIVMCPEGGVTGSMFLLRTTAFQAVLRHGQDARGTS
jgi:hypothetical protein